MQRAYTYDRQAYDARMQHVAVAVHYASIGRQSALSLSLHESAVLEFEIQSST